MTENNKKELPEAEKKELKRRHSEALGNALFWANDMGLTLEEFLKLGKK